jgi:GNAT superfamily N-acetyltransferase
MRETSLWSRALLTIDPKHRPDLRDHLLRLDEDARLQRFCHLADNAHVRAHVERIDFRNGRVIGCYENGQMRGAAELRPSGAPCSRVLEATFSVEGQWQGRGIGTALLLRAISVARQLGARHLLVDRLASNPRMRRILTQFDSYLFFDQHDCKAWLPLVETSSSRRPQARQRFMPQD